MNRVFQNGSETKCQSTQWGIVGSTFANAKKYVLVMSRTKMRILTFSSQPGCDLQRINAWRKNSEQWIICTDEGKVVKQSWRVRPQFLVSLFFLHDNGPAHCAMIEELPGEPCVVEKATHLINLTLCQLTYLFPPHKGIKFQDIKDIKNNVTAKLNWVPLVAFNDCSFRSSASA